MYSSEQVIAMSEAFDLVKDEKNWKMPIDAVVPADADIALIEDAVVFYAGCLPDVTEQPDGTFRVTAPGYYMSIGS